MPATGKPVLDSPAKWSRVCNMRSTDDDQDPHFAYDLPTCDRTGGSATGPKILGMGLDAGIESSSYMFDQSKNAPTDGAMSLPGKLELELPLQ